jgi:hypothetical protein
MMRSYRPGLFQCYRAPDPPQSNNDLEHLLWLASASRAQDRLPQATPRPTFSGQRY